MSRQHSPQTVRKQSANSPQIVRQQHRVREDRRNWYHQLVEYKYFGPIRRLIHQELQSRQLNSPDSKPLNLQKLSKVIQHGHRSDLNRN